MKHPAIYGTVLSVLLLGACGNPGKPISSEPKVTLTEEEQHLQLTREDLFAGDKIRLYLKKDTLQGTESNELFLTALDAYKNKKKTDEAAEGFIQSILRFPTAKAYYELGNVYMDQKKYSDALLAYRMAENLNYEPFSKLMYNIACVYSCLEKGQQSADYLEYAVQAGYLNVDNIAKDEDLSYLRNEYSYMYQAQLRRALNGVSDADKIYYLQFKKRFPIVKLPLNIKETISKTHFDMENAITYDFEKYIPEMRDEKFSREVSKGFYYYAKVAETADYTALIYIIREEFLGEQAPLTYKLVTFNKEGKIIDQLIVAGRENLNEELRTCSMNSQMEITVDLYETKYEKDPETEGYYDNPITSKSKVGTEHFKINTNGTIVETDRTA